MAFLLVEPGGSSEKATAVEMGDSAGADESAAQSLEVSQTAVGRNHEWQPYL